MCRSHQLATTRSLFATSSDKSARYIRDNRAEVDRKADRLLEKARNTFEGVDTQADAVGMLRVAKEALEYANAAYDSASGDVNAAAAARREAERRRREAREAEERAARRRREEEEARQQSYYHSSSTYSSSSSGFSGGDFGGSSGSSGW